MTTFSRTLSALALAATVGLSACTASDAPNPAQESPTEPESLSVTVLEHTSMIPDSFTQGLEVDAEGNLLVGTGQYGQSRLMRLRPGETTPSQSVDLDPEFFGEGITQAGEHIWQLTWKAGEAIQRDAATFEETGRVRYPGEGWGLCNAGSQLVMSDGSAQLRHLDPQTFEEIAPRTTVTRQGQPVDNLNELECVDGAVFANVWMSEEILRIDPDSGQVTGVIDAAGLNENGPRTPDDVLNGIAHIPGTDEFWITGKRWVDLYRVRFE
ncbi:glutaminyl-peptide cyclotransferase [Corynebacterium sp.]|uniref:glutaminyl-peptide cyclotransferase n=1 Tax=Corynebacterium sp. TaxID=1720 RepID=UPI0026DCDBE4|nr:glutaminyl-peptide cyclotransferase [Corynebacterium sp.]MDO5032722.1 glutaminyl-peptide cyclotransferase [Corynebacterium sp.]